MGICCFFGKTQENTTIYLCAFGFLKKESKTKTFGHMATLIISRREKNQNHQSLNRSPKLKGILGRLQVQAQQLQLCQVFEIF